MRAFTLYTRILGAEHAPTIVFLPGFTGSHQTWNTDFQALQRRYKLVFFDVLGFGRSPKPNIDYSIDDHLSAIQTTLQALQIRTMNLVGYSMGSLLSLAYAARFPAEVAKVTLLALPFYPNEQEARRVLESTSLFNRLLALDNGFASRACELMCHLRPLLKLIVPWVVRDVPAVVAKDALEHTWSSYARTLRNVIFKAEALQWLKSLQSPLLLIHGRKDRTAPFEHVQTIPTLLPKTKFVAFDTDHHLVFRQSQVITSEISLFLQHKDNPPHRRSR